MFSLFIKTQLLLNYLLTLGVCAHFDSSFYWIANHLLYPHQCGVGQLVKQLTIQKNLTVFWLGLQMKIWTFFFHLLNFFKFRPSHFVITGHSCIYK